MSVIRPVCVVGGVNRCVIVYNLFNIHTYFHITQTRGAGVDCRTTKRERRSITESRRPVSGDPVCGGVW